MFDSDALLVTRKLRVKATSTTKDPLKKGAELPNFIKLAPAHVGPPMRANAEQELAIPNICPCSSGGVIWEIRLFNIG